MPFAWIPNRAQSAHIARVSWRSPPFDAVYGPIVSRPSSLVAEQVLTIFPRLRSIICGTTARETRNALVRFVSRTRCQSSSSSFPRFSRNLNTGEDVGTGTRMQVAHQTVLHTAAYPSHVLLPVTG